MKRRTVACRKLNEKMSKIIFEDKLKYLEKNSIRDGEFKQA